MTPSICVALGLFMQSAVFKLKDEHFWSTAFFLTAVLVVSGERP